MDQYSLHNFMIYEGRSLQDTPEFQSFKRLYSHEWGSVCAVIKLLEDLLSENSIKLAFINGPSIFSLASLNLAIIDREDLLNCISNIEQILPMLNSLRNVGNDNSGTARAAIKIQSIVRRKLSRNRVAILRKELSTTIFIQSHIRLYLYRLKSNTNNRSNTDKNEEIWKENEEKLKNIWSVSSNPESLRVNKERILIIIPSYSVGEYLRLEMDNVQASQNTLINSLHYLADPDVSIVYVSPVQVGIAEKAYHDRLLSIMGISTLPKRISFVVPELIHRLPQHLAISTVLWCSSTALKRLRGHIKRSANTFILPGTPGWVEKRISCYLNCPIFGPSNVVAENITSRSISKRIFMEASANIPIGAHDINNNDDLIIALSRLIASNIDVKRWLIRLNTDSNNESCVCVDVDRFSIYSSLKEEQEGVVKTNGHISAWFSKNIQLNIRKRLMEVLKKELPRKVKINRKDIYPTWDVYMQHIRHIGAIIEGQPLELLGYVNGLCIIEPDGVVNVLGGVDVIVDKYYQQQGTIYPQSYTPTLALHGASKAIATFIHGKYNIIGHVTFKFQAFWDPVDEVPRLWAIGIHLGLTSSFGSFGSTSVLVSKDASIPKSLCPVINHGKFYVHIPVAIHGPLQGARDDIFFKFCRMKGIAFDVQQHTGTLFFLIDTTSSGAISLLFISNSRRKSLELALDTLAFIVSQYGKDSSEQIKPEHMTSIILRLRYTLNQDTKDVK
jgi:hypothetical protein